jgi:hypothetical protein
MLQLLIDYLNFNFHIHLFLVVFLKIEILILVNVLNIFYIITNHVFL